MKSDIFVSEQKALIRMEKDKARMTEVFLELDDDADGLWVSTLFTVISTHNERRFLV